MDKQMKLEKREEKAVRQSYMREGAFVDLLNQEMKELQDSMKQKQIEEMVRFIDIHNEAKKIAKLMPSDIVGYDGKPKSQHLYIEQKMEIAKEIIKQGAVVLTREEFEVYEFVKKKHASNEEVRSSEIVQGILHHIKTVRKETAKKFAEMAKERRIEMGTDGHSYCMVFVDDIDEIAKGFMEGKV